MEMHGKTLILVTSDKNGLFLYAMPFRHAFIELSISKDIAMWF